LTVVLEVAYSQTAASVRAKAQRWLHETMCRLVVIISVSEQRQNLWAEVYQRGVAAATQHLDFGGNRCIGLGQCVLNLPLNEIFHGVIVPLALAALHPNGQLPLDLWPIKAQIMDL